MSVLAALAFTGYVAARGSNVTGPPSWLDHDFGRLDVGGDQNELTGVAHLGFDWTPTTWLNVHASAAARDEGSGLIEAYADVRKEFSLDELKLRGGFFFLPTSKENRGDNWSSPYTINFSALNSWIGEEVRPLGLDLQYRHTLDNGHSITAGATAFRGNDTMGTLLAWRGWTVGDRLSAYDERLPLPPLGSLADSGAFRKQNDAGTKPFGPDLDEHTGYSARVRYSVPQRGNIQYTYLDNGGDRLLYGSEYSWDTKFHLLGAEVGNPDEGFVLATEYMRGETYMGVLATHVEAGFYATYLLMSDKFGRNRFSARYDLFGAEDEDESPLAEDNEETGRSWTLTWMYDVTPAVRAALEFTQVTGNRPAAQQYGFDPVTDGRSWTVEVRYRF